MDFFAVNNFGDTRSGGLAGPMGLFIILLMCIATVLLVRNMNKRLRRLPDSFVDVDEQRRNDEVARLEADLDGPDATPGRPAIDDAGSPHPVGDSETQVSAPGTEERPASSDGGGPRP